MLTKDDIDRIAEYAKFREECHGFDGADARFTDSRLAELCRLALLGLERDERALRIGRAVLAQEGDETPRDLRNRAVAAERYGYESYGALLRAIAAAMEEP